MAFRLVRRGLMTQAQRSVSLMTFNILAPCYFRHEGHLESDARPAYLSRAHALINAIGREHCDLLCFQEYWFNDEYQDVFSAAFRPTHYMFAAKRPGEKEDGVAVFVDKHKFDVHHVEQIQFGNVGDRVALMLHLATNWNRSESPLKHRSFLLVNSHLTFPHNDVYRNIRLAQIKVVLDSIQAYLKEKRLEHAPVIMCGDFNASNDPVHHLVTMHGFSSVFSQIHGREARITHCNHNKDEVGVDFIFATQLGEDDETDIPDEFANHRLQVVPTRCSLWPSDMPDRTRLKRPSFARDWRSVHPPSGSTLQEAEWTNYWRMISDHRPVVAKFEMYPPFESVRRAGNA